VQASSEKKPLEQNDVMGVSADSCNITLWKLAKQVNRRISCSMTLRKYCREFAYAVSG